MELAESSWTVKTGLVDANCVNMRAACSFFLLLTFYQYQMHNICLISLCGDFFHVAILLN